MAKSKVNIPDGLKGAFKSLEKMNEYSSILSENSLSVVKDYIDTGSMALNGIISGSLYKGVPKGRITGLVGPTGSGKTLILSKIIANAQKKDPDVWGVVWDSENAYDPQMAINVGAKPDQIIVNPVTTVEECRNQISTFVDGILSDPSIHGKIVIGVDSLGNLASAKEMADAEKGKDAVDMGMRAKAIKSFFRVLTMKLAACNTTLIYTNHIYDNPTQMFASLVKNQAGGKSPLYMSSLLVQLAVTQQKMDDSNEKDVFIPLANKVKGVNLRALTVKNRIVPEMLQTSMYLNYKTGLYKYSGLLEMALAYDIITKEGNTYYLPDGTKLGFEKKFKDDVTFWETHVLKQLDDILQKELVFSNESDSELVEELSKSTKEDTIDAETE